VLLLVPEFVLVVSSGNLKVSILVVFRLGNSSSTLLVVLAAAQAVASSGGVINGYDDIGGQLYELTVTASGFFRWCCVRQCETTASDCTD
jgi:hypothetical protein